MKIELNVPTVWSDGQIARWAAKGNERCAIHAVFGCLQTQLGGHGRAPRDVPYVAPDRLVQHAAHARSVGLEFLYLLNGLCRHLDFDVDSTRASFFRQLDWILQHVSPDCLVVSDQRVARLVRSAWSPREIRIRVSTIAGVRNPADLVSWIPLGIDGVVLHHDVGRDFAALAELSRFVAHEAPHVKLELILNESCNARCPARQVHYARLAATTLDHAEGFQQACNIGRFLEPVQLLAARWIRPEDVERYRDFGVSRFKIAGREMSADWLDRCVRAYTEGRYDGNLYDLLTMTPPGLGVGAEHIVHLENASLEGFLDDVASHQQDQDGVYRRWAHRLWREGAFRIQDPAGQYVTTVDGPRCRRPGKYLGLLVEQLDVQDELLRGADLASLFCRTPTL